MQKIYITPNHSYEILYPIRQVVHQKVIYFSNRHETIVVSSLNLRHQKFNEYRNLKSHADSHADTYKPNATNNPYYSSTAIKCELKEVGEDQIYLIADGHRRFIEGILQGYTYFLVELGSGADPKATESRKIKIKQDLPGIRLESINGVLEMKLDSKDSEDLFCLTLA